MDGFIGANLMRKAIWQLDYERHIITITSSRDSLSVPPNAQNVTFHPARVGTLMIDVQLNGQTDRNVTVDLGSNGDFCSSTETLKMLKQDGLRTNTYSYGFGSAGLYGRGKEDTTWYAIIPAIRLGSLEISSQAVSFIEKRAKTIGANFFKNYRLIFDWSTNELTMIPVTPYNNASHKMFNFTHVLKDHKIFIGSVYSTRNATVDGPQLGDQVLEIDSKDYRSCSGERWC